MQNSKQFTGARPACVETLERRALCAAGVEFVESPLGFRGTLVVTGDDGGDDVITLRTDSTESQIRVTINGDEQSFERADIRLILARGLGGNDEISVLDNFELGRMRVVITLEGGEGNDTLTGGAGGEAFRGGPGDDTISAADGWNFIQGGEGDDRITAGDDRNLVMTGPGANVVRTGDGVDRVIAGGDNDDVETGGGNDTVSGGAGNDLIDLGDGNNRAAGGAGNDAITAGDGDDFIRGNAGDDVLDAGGGDNDVLQDDPPRPERPPIVAPFKHPTGYLRYIARYGPAAAQRLIETHS